MQSKPKLILVILSLLLTAALVVACGGGAPEAVQEAKEAAEGAAEQAQEAVEEAAGQAQEAVEEAADQAQEAAEEAVEQTEAAVEEVTEQVEEAVTSESTMTASMVELPEVDPLSVTGDIIVAGSSTVFPLTEAMAERFQDEGYAGNVTIDSIGSGAGFERFCVAGETDISNASRAINEEEVASCQAIGREPIEYRVGTDALAVAVSAENDFAEDITLEELALAFSTAETWADVRAEWPAEPIQRFSPGTDSGTFDYFVEAVFDENEEPILSAANLQLSEDDNVLVQGVEGSPYAIGYFGYAYFQENEGLLKALAVDGVSPTAESAEDGSYPLARPLYIYSDATVMAEKPQVAAFINFYLTYVNDEILEVGYFPASGAALDMAKTNWLEATGAEGGTASTAPESSSAMAAGELPAVDPLSVTGDIIVAGSSTVFPLTEAMAERFQDEGYAGNVTIDSIGSGAGFERFCVAGETDISNASRAINEEEVASCQAIGREPIEYRVGTDALAVAVSAENDFAEDITLEELALAFSTAETWADVRAEWPAEPIQRFSPGTDSGTFDYFVEAVFDEDEEPILSAANLQLSEDDNVLVQGVEGSPYAIGYFGYAYFQENEGLLKALAVDGVSPTAESAEDGSYPLARPLYIYSDATVMAEKPQVAAFINFYLTYVNDEILEVGYFPASDSALTAAKNSWLEAMGMETMSGSAAPESSSAMAAGELPAVDPLSVTGDIIVAGSSTVFPLTEAMAERFQDEGYAGNVTIDSIGSGAGFERFCVAGETDISNASRGINEEEVASCQGIGREPIEYRVGTDALAVAVSAENDFAEDITLEELALAFSTAETWADVRAEWPAEPIQRFSPGTDSGTFDYFVEAVFDEDEEPILSAANLQLSEDDNVLVQGVEGSPYAIGYFGYAYFQENEGLLKALAVDGVSPTAESAEDGSYPLARPLYIYSDATVMAEKPQVAAFINFYLTYVNDEILEVGYFPASDSALTAAKNSWLEAMQ